MLWMLANRRLILFGLGSVLLFSTGLYSGNVLCDLSKAKEERIKQERINKMINDANQASEMVEKERARIKRIQAKLAKEVANEKDRSFGCVFNADGMRGLHRANALYSGKYSE